VPVIYWRPWSTPHQFLLLILAQAFLCSRTSYVISTQWFSLFPKGFGSRSLKGSGRVCAVEVLTNCSCNSLFGLGVSMSHSLQREPRPRFGFRSSNHGFYFWHVFPLRWLDLTFKVPKKGSNLRHKISIKVTIKPWYQHSQMPTNFILVESSQLVCKPVVLFQHLSDSAKLVQAHDHLQSKKEKLHRSSGKLSTLRLE